jgi:hypothetical protein
MMFYFSNRRVSPLIAVGLFVALLLLIPVISGFMLLMMASAILGWIGLALRRSFLGSKSPSFENLQDTKIVVIDKNDNVITSIKDS